MVSGLAERHGDEQPCRRAAGRDRAPAARRTRERQGRPRRRARSRCCRPRRARASRRAAPGRTLRSAKRQRADIGHDRLHALDIALGEIDADELDARAEEACEVRRARRTHSRPRARDPMRPAARAPTGSRRPARRFPAAPGATRAAHRAPARPGRARRRRRARARVSNSGAVTSSCRNVARESVPSASFASARSRASSSGGRRSTSRNAALDELLVSTCVCVERRRRPAGPQR